MNEAPKVTAQNLQLCIAARDALRSNLEKLARQTEKYPVECRFGGYRYVFESRAEIDALIAALDEGIAKFAA
jgi:hypothetical protein